MKALDQIYFTKKNKMEQKKVVLAYSGGLDTSYCLKKLYQENQEVHNQNPNHEILIFREVQSHE